MTVYPEKEQTMQRWQILTEEYTLHITKALQSLNQIRFIFDA